MKLHKKLLFLTGIFFLFSGSSIFASEHSPTDILNQTYKYIGSMDTYAFKAVIIDSVIEDKGKVSKKRYDVSVKINRPGKLRADTKGPDRDRSNYINNGVYTIMDYDYGYYGQIKTPKTIDGTLDFIFEKFGIRTPLVQLIYSDMDKRLRFIKSKNFGTMTVDGIECNYLAFGDLEREIHLWIETGNQPLVKAYSIIEKKGGKKYRVNTSVHWDTNAKISDSDFIFKAPKGAAKISINSAN